MTARLVLTSEGRLCPKTSTYDGLPEGFARQDSEGVVHLGLADTTCLVTTPVMLSVAETQDPITMVVTLGVSSRLTLIEDHQGAAKLNTNINLHQQAKLVHAVIAQGATNSPATLTTTATLAQGAYHDYVIMTSGASPLTHSMRTTMRGEMAQAKLQALLFLAKAAHALVTFDVTHASSHATSHQNIRTILHDKTRAEFRGRIHVCPDAQKTEARQLARALVLSDQATMQAVPELAIEADDVVCSHGCACGTLNEDALFLLRARGIPENQARALLIAGFAREVVDTLPHDVAAVLGSRFDEWLKNMSLEQNIRP